MLPLCQFCFESALLQSSFSDFSIAQIHVLIDVLFCLVSLPRFKCDRPVSLGMNIDSLTKILKMTATNDSLKIRYQHDADTVNFQCEGSDDRIADFDLKLMQIESEHMEIPEQHYKVVARLPSAEFQKICRDLKEFGETIQISASKEGLKFMVQGDLGSGNVVLKPRQGDKPEDTVTLTVHEPVSATFALRYLVNFAKAEKLCGAVELGLGPDAPLLVKYDLESADKGHMQFYLAPKIDE